MDQAIEKKAAVSDAVADVFEQALAIYIDDVNGSREGWDFWLNRMAVDTGKYYSNVSYDKAVWKEAQSD